VQGGSAYYYEGEGEVTHSNSTTDSANGIGKCFFCTGTTLRFCICNKAPASSGAIATYWDNGPAYLFDTIMIDGQGLSGDSRRELPILWEDCFFSNCASPLFSGAVTVTNCRFTNAGFPGGATDGGGNVYGQAATGFTAEFAVRGCPLGIPPWTVAATRMATATVSATPSFTWARYQPYTARRRFLTMSIFVWMRILK
jgi:hypothetical protein